MALRELDGPIGLTEKGERMPPHGNSLWPVKEEQMLSGQNDTLPMMWLREAACASLRKEIWKKIASGTQRKFSSPVTVGTSKKRCSHVLGFISSLETWLNDRSVTNYHILHNWPCQDLTLRTMGKWLLDSCIVLRSRIHHRHMFKLEWNCLSKSW